MDLSNEALSARIGSLRAGFDSRSTNMRSRHTEYLRVYSPPWSDRLKDHDQWDDPILAKDKGHVRSSFNETRGRVDKWTALEASEFPNVRWVEDFLATPTPSLDEAENALRVSTYRAEKLIERHISTMREQALYWHIRRAKAHLHWFRAVRKKNIYGHSWLRVVPDQRQRLFRFQSRIDPSTVYPVWAASDDPELDAILVAYRRSAYLAAAQYPDAVSVDAHGLIASDSSYYQPTSSGLYADTDRQFVWVEDFWTIDREAEGERNLVDGEPVEGLVVNATRINGKIVARTEYPGWSMVPYFLVLNEDEGNPLGYSDAGGAKPYQDALNRTLSQQQDIIYGSSRPKFKFRTEGEREIDLIGDEYVRLDPDEDFEQIQVHQDVYPAQTHLAQVRQSDGRSSGLPPTVHGEITAAQNSGRALATAWKATATSLVPRNMSNEETITRLVTFMVDGMELYDWSGARALYKGNRDFEVEFPNQEPRDRAEVTLEAVNALNAGLEDVQGAMEMRGERSPDEKMERIRADYMDAVRYPDKAQGYLMLAGQKQRLEIEARQAGIQEQAAQLQMSAMANAPSGGAPSGASPEQAAGAAEQARTQAEQGRAPQMTQYQNAPATAPGAAANPTQTSVMLQGGETSNRSIQKGSY
jgi:hypothetical protein